MGVYIQLRRILNRFQTRKHQKLSAIKFNFKTGLSHLKAEATNCVYSGSNKTPID